MPHVGEGDGLDDQVPGDPVTWPGKIANDIRNYVSWGKPELTQR